VNIRRSLGLVCPIIAAAAMGFADIVKLLVEAKASVNDKIHDGQTALHYAAAEGHLDVIMYLIEGGKNISLHIPLPNIITIIIRTLVMFPWQNSCPKWHRNSSTKSYLIQRSRGETSGYLLLTPACLSIGRPPLLGIAIPN